MALPKSLQASAQRIAGTPAQRQSLTAAVKQMSFERDTSTIGMGGNPNEDDWQAEAWRYANCIGELSAVVRWMGASAARVTLKAVKVDESTGQADTPSEDPTAVRLVQDMAGGSTGQSGMMRQAATFLTVVGEFYVVILQNQQTQEEEWSLIAPDKANKDSMSGAWKVIVDGEEREVDAERESIFRVWQPDPHEPEKATSSVRAALPILAEIEAMDKLVKAVSRSRVAGNGILVIPSEASIPSPNGPTAGEVPGVPSPMGISGPQSAGNLSAALSSAMKTATTNPDSPASIVPIVISAPGEHIDKFKHLTFGSELTDTATSTREKAIRRLALSLDIPPEVLLGLGDSTHWNAAMVDEAALRQHIAPMMSTICEALTEAVLHPVMAGADDVEDEDENGVPEDYESIVVGFDMSALSQKQDNSTNAIAAYDKGAISIDSLRRELGFGDDDKPTEVGDEERLMALALKVVEQAPSLFPILADFLGFPESVTKAAGNAAQEGISSPPASDIASRTRYQWGA